MANIVRFDCYEVDLACGQLYKHGVRLRLRDQSLVLLGALLEHPGEVVTREDLRRRLWHDDVFVDFDNNLNTVLGRLREALNDSADHPRFIETIPKRGYRFIAEVYPVPSPPARVAARRARLLVLPFANLSGEPREEYFCDAMTDEVITSIAGLSAESLGVIARTTAMRYKGSRKNVEQIGREVALDYVVEGGIRRAGGRVAVNVQLIQVTDQTHLFARKYDAEAADIFQLQSDIARDIAAHIPSVTAKLAASIQGVGARATRATSNLVAYNEYIQGRHEMAKMTAASFTAAIQRLEKAVTLDPEFALAYDALAETYWYLCYVSFMEPAVAASAGIVHALRAIEIDNSRAETHALLGQFHTIAGYKWAEVEREMALARRLDPNSPVVRARYALSGLMPHGRVDEAASELEAALELDPLSLVARYWFAIMLLLARHFQRGIDEARRLVALDPNYYSGYFAIAIGHRSRGEFGEAVAFQRKAVELSGGSPGMWAWLGQMLALGGHTAEARDVLRKLNAMATDRYVPPTTFAWVHLGLGEIDTAFEWLNRAVEKCDQLMVPIKSYPFMDPIRTDPRFAALLRKMNLES